MFEPVIVKKRQRRLSDVDAVAIGLFAKGLTTGEISAYFAEVYGASIGKDTVSRITDKVLEEMATWSSRPLQPVYAAISGSTWKGGGTCSDCGPARAVVSRRSSG